MDPTTAELAIDAFEIAESNLLLSFMGIKPNQVYKQVLPEFNSIGWIFGHCAVHLHWVFDLTYKKKRTYSEDVCHYFRYGTTKDEILQNASPITFKELVDGYLEVSKSSIEYLQETGAEIIHNEFTPQPGETLLHQIYRIIFHYMGHMGQIVMIRRALGNPGRSFVDGVTKPQRAQLMQTWNDWWKKNRNSFTI
jgi:hypothetical protein